MQGLQDRTQFMRDASLNSSQLLRPMPSSVRGGGVRSSLRRSSGGSDDQPPPAVPLAPAFSSPPPCAPALLGGIMAMFDTPKTRKGSTDVDAVAAAMNAVGVMAGGDSPFGLEDTWCLPSGTAAAGQAPGALAAAAPGALAAAAAGDVAAAAAAAAAAAGREDGEGAAASTGRAAPGGRKRSAPETHSEAAAAGEVATSGAGEQQQPSRPGRSGSKKQRVRGGAAAAAGAAASAAADGAPLGAPEAAATGAGTSGGDGVQHGARASRQRSAPGGSCPAAAASSGGHSTRSAAEADEGDAAAAEQRPGSGVRRRSGRGDTVTGPGAEARPSRQGGEAAAATPPSGPVRSRRRSATAADAHAPGDQLTPLDGSRGGGKHAAPAAVAGGKDGRPRSSRPAVEPAGSTPVPGSGSQPSASSRAFKELSMLLADNDRYAPYTAWQPAEGTADGKRPSRFRG